MNVSIFVDSFKYLRSHKSVVLLATWINQELTRRRYHYTKLIKSFDKDHMDIAEELIKINNDPLVLNMILCEHIVRSDNNYRFRTDNVYQQVKLLLEHGADVHQSDDMLLICASWNMKHEVVILLLTFGADASVSCYAPLRWLCNCGRPDIVKMILNSNLNDEHILYYAISCGGTIETIETILSVRDWTKVTVRISDVSYNFSSLFKIAAIRSFRLEVIKLLTEHSRDIHYINAETLHFCASGRYFDIINYLLSLSPNVEEIERTINYLTSFNKNYNLSMIDLLTCYLQNKATCELIW